MKISEDKSLMRNKIIDESGTVWEVTSAWCAVCSGAETVLKRRYNRAGYSPDLVVYLCYDCGSEWYEDGLFTDTNVMEEAD